MERSEANVGLRVDSVGVGPRSRWWNHAIPLLLGTLLVAACRSPGGSALPPGDATAVEVGATAAGDPAAGQAAEDTSLTVPGTLAPTQATAASGPLPVVATFSILGDIVQQVGGEHVAVTVLVGPGGDTHTFEPSPADGVALAEAALVFENGLGLEPWLNDLYNASGSKSSLAVVTDGLTLLPTPMEDAHAGGVHTQPGAESAAGSDAGHAADAHQHGNEFDPHVWHDVARVKGIAEAVQGALVEADPAHAADYRAAAAGYRQALDELDAYVSERVGRIPPERRKLATVHDTFRYFAARYGFEIIGTALASASTEAADPSAAHIAYLADQIRAAGVPVIFAENVQNPRLMEQIAREAGVTLGPPLYSDALGEPGSAGDSYIGMMRANADTLAEALGSP